MVFFFFQYAETRKHNVTMLKYILVFVMKAQSILTLLMATVRKRADFAVGLTYSLHWLSQQKHIQFGFKYSK